MSTENTPTPETDAKQFSYFANGSHHQVVGVKDARTLERERDALKAQLTEALARAEKAERELKTWQHVFALFGTDPEQVGQDLEEKLSEVTTLRQQLTTSQARVEELEKEVKSAKAEAYSWRACVRVRENAENKSPCGHHANHAYSPDGVGKVIRCYICERDALAAERDRLKEELILVKDKANRLWHQANPEPGH